MPDDDLFGPVSLALIKHLLGLFVRDGDLSRAALLGKLDLHSYLLTILVLNLDALQGLRALIDELCNLLEQTLVVQIIVVHLKLLERVDALRRPHSCHGICSDMRGSQANVLEPCTAITTKAFEVVVVQTKLLKASLFLDEVEEISREVQVGPQLWATTELDRLNFIWQQIKSFNELYFFVLFNEHILLTPA